jgi:hypothetical protein
MHITELEERKEMILVNEEKMAWQLALYVIEKPTPRIWMIFIPIFFVFYFWKLKEFENGLKTFSENHLLSRRRTLEAALAATESDRPVDISALVDQVEGLQEEARACYARWLTVLAGHYRLLLQAGGDNYPALIRTAYRNKANYLAFCRELGGVESAFDMALLPTIDGESTEICAVTEKMIEGLDTLRSREAEEIFS